ncbi:MAG: inositol monophosphatase, partial [Actinomycetota bacterium]|nr:inositol monophosphatase [Actinomycetota bacterium]
MEASEDFEELARLAAELAAEAGQVLSAGRHADRTGLTTKTSSTDMVSDVDRASEALIDRRLSELRPHDGIVGEEGASRPGTSGVSWIIDPLDG